LKKEVAVAIAKLQKEVLSSPDQKRSAATPGRSRKAQEDPFTLSCVKPHTTIQQILQ
jgi:hypothetical protein